MPHPIPSGSSVTHLLLLPAFGALPLQEEAEALAAQACYLVREAAFDLWQPVAGRCKDYVAAPKSNGYQSLHSTVR